MMVVDCVRSSATFIMFRKSQRWAKNRMEDWGRASLGCLNVSSTSANKGFIFCVMMLSWERRKKSSVTILKHMKHEYATAVRPRGDLPSVDSQICQIVQLMSNNRFPFCLSSDSRLHILFELF